MLSSIQNFKAQAIDFVATKRSNMTSAPLAEAKPDTFSVQFGHGIDPQVWQDIMAFKQQLAQRLGCQTIADLPRKGVMRVAIGMSPDAQEEETHTFEVVIAESKFRMLDMQIPRQYKQYRVYTSSTPDNNMPIS